MSNDSEPTSEVFTPKKSNLSRQAIEKNALRKSLGSSLPSSHLPIRPTDDRPSYSTDYLNELKSSTPSTPKNLKSLSDVEAETTQALDIASKFGTDLSSYQNTSIPTDAEIAEKKERRARLAKEQDFLPLDSASNPSEDDDDNDPETTFSARTHKKEPETRLVRDDEDIAEGFDSFVSDGRISLSKRAEREQKRRHKAEMRDLIAEAEGTSGEETDDSEAERRAEYEAAQTRKGMDGLHHEEEDEAARRPRTPPKITPLPSLSACLEKLRARLTQMEYTRGQKVREMEMYAREKADIGVREVEIQKLLAEAGERYEKLRQEAGIGVGGGLDEKSAMGNGNGNGGLVVGRGLETLGLGNTPAG